MFSFANEGKVWWRVNLVARDASGGDPTEAPVSILYRIYTRKELKARERKLLEMPLANLRAAKDAAAVQAAVQEYETLEAGNDAELRERVVGWRDIVTASGDQLPFTQEALDALLNDEAQYPRIAAGLVEASKGARAKNSSPGAAGSQAPGPN